MHPADLEIPITTICFYRKYSSPLHVLHRNYTDAAILYVTIPNKTGNFCILSKQSLEIMKSSKSFPLLLVLMVLNALAIVLMTVWGYNVYLKKDSTSRLQSEMVVHEDTLPYMPVTHQKEKSLTNVSFQDTQQTNLPEATALFTPQDSTFADSINDQHLAVLMEKNDSLTLENQRLQELVTELTDQKPDPIPDRTKKPAHKTVQDKRTGQVSISNLRLYAITPERYITTIAKETQNFTVNLILISQGIPGGIIYFVIIEPNGQVLHDPAGNSGTFQSDDGKMVYSKKLPFVASGKKIHFSMNVATPQKGTYQLWAYYSGKRISSLKKTLK